MGIKGQYRFPTRDYVEALRFLGLGDELINPDNLPTQRSTFKQLLKRKMAAIYRKDVAEAGRKGLWLLSRITEPDRALCHLKPYKGLIANLGRLLGVEEPTSNQLKPIARLLFNNIKLRWNHADSRRAAGITDADIPKTKRARNLAASSHRCRLCRRTQNNYNHHLIYDCAHFNAIRPGHMAAGLSLRASPAELADWVTVVAQMQAEIEG